MREAREILDELYARHFDGQQPSTVTSSHWRSVGKHAVQRVGNKFEVQGVGFGNFSKKTLKNSLKRLIQTRLCLGLLKDFGCDPFVGRAAIEVVDRVGRLFDFDCAKQALSVTWVKKALAERFDDIKTVCIIGDGYGFMGALLRRTLPNASVLSVNLGRTLFFDVYYSSQASETPAMNLLIDEESTLCEGALNFLEAEKYNLLIGKRVDLFISIASMQEMDPPIIQKYFEYMGQSQADPVYFYCCNRERKHLPDGTIVEFDKYPWGHARSIFDERCPWYQKYPASLPPFWRPFDGPTRHRLVKIK